MKTGRQPERDPIDAPAKYISRGATNHDLEQSVLRTHEPAAIRMDDAGGAIAADARIDDAQKNRSWRELARIRGQQLGGGLRIVCRRVGKEIDDIYPWRVPQQNGFRLPVVWAAQAEVREQGDHCALDELMRS